MGVFCIAGMHGQRNLLLLPQANFRASFLKILVEEK
jgi:hypothetical protein